jgi:GNAT superfamily N-acetyltransferase
MSDRDALLRAAAATWPAAEAEVLGGWLLRSTPSVDRTRSNSALPLVAEPEVEVAERWYAERGRPVQVQVTPLEERGTLDTELAVRGWEALRPADTLTARVADLPGPDAPIALVTSPAERWLDAWARCEQRSREDVDAHARAILRRLAGRNAAFALAPGGRGVALGVASGGYCGIFCVSVHQDARRQGIATSLVCALGDWARGVGAATAFVQVARDNAGGHALWSRLGFEHDHAYVTRRQL